MWVASELRWNDEGEESDAGMIDLLVIPAHGMPMAQYCDA